jgi:GDPmannose 4,6-dehydratase
VIVEIDPRYFRPTEGDDLRGDPSKAQRVLGWRHTTTFPEMVAEMVAADLETVKQEVDRRDRRG